jgi:hypothetical protein
MIAVHGIPNNVSGRERPWMPFRPSPPLPTSVHGWRQAQLRLTEPLTILQSPSLRRSVCHQPGCTTAADGTLRTQFSSVPAQRYIRRVLLLVAGTVLARGRARGIFFALIACTLPFVLLAALEMLAGAVDLSDRVAAPQNVSTIESGSDWGPGKNHLAAKKDGFVLYRPWSGNGVTVNELGLRTAPPGPRSPASTVLPWSAVHRPGGFVSQMRIRFQPCWKGVARQQSQGDISLQFRN